MAALNQSTGTVGIYVKHSHRWLQLESLQSLFRCICACLPCLLQSLWPTGVIGVYICLMKFWLLQLDLPFLQQRSSKEQMGFTCAPCPPALSSIPYRDLEMFHLKTWYILIKLRQGDRVIHQLCLHLKEMKYVIIVRSTDIMALLCKILIGPKVAVTGSPNEHCQTVI